jgi:hypothetical protein
MPDPSSLKASLAPDFATLMRVRSYEYHVAKLVSSSASLRPVGVANAQNRQSVPLPLLQPTFFSPSVRVLLH